LVGEEALPVRERGARITCVTTLCENGWQGRKGVAETFNSFLESVGVFGFGKFVRIWA
jgi:hypothetical protein